MKKQIFRIIFKMYIKSYFACLAYLSCLVCLAFVACSQPDSKNILEPDQYKGIAHLKDLGVTTTIKDYASISFRGDAYEVLLDATPSRGDLLCEFGHLAGTACLPNGLDLAGAQIKLQTLDCQNQPLILETVSDSNGRFAFMDVPTGPGQLSITLGRYDGKFAVNILADRVNAPSASGSTKICLVPSESRMAVTTGNYDQVEMILNELDLKYDLYCAQPNHYRPALKLLDDPTLLGQYQTVLVNCGSGIDLSHPQNAQTIDALQNFVRNGGSLYFSDLALSILDHVWPNVVNGDYQERNRVFDPCCDCSYDCDASCLLSQNDSNPMSSDPMSSDPSNLKNDFALNDFATNNVDPTLNGDSAFSCLAFNDLLPACQNRYGILATGHRGEVQAKVVGENLKIAVGFDELPILFDLGGWVKINSVAQNVEVLVAQKGKDSEGVFERPLMVRFKPYEGGGWVAYTSFHYHPQLSQQVKALLLALVLRL
jgi:hypothetical protein